MRRVDQSGFDNQHPATETAGEWLDAAQATALLQIKAATLYAYVSRGQVRAVPAPAGERGHRYLRDDLLRQKARAAARAGHGAVAAAALRFGEPVLASAICQIDPGVAPEHGAKGAPSALRYRGVPLPALLALSFEEVALLLWRGALPGPAEAVGFTAPDLGVAVPRLRALLPADATPLLVLPLFVAALALQDPSRHGAVGDAEQQRARALVRRLAAVLALPARPGRVAAALAAPSVAAAVLGALGGDAGCPQAVRAVDRVLIACADHELNASTFAARVAASTGADLYACVGAGLGALSGPRHGGECDRLEALLAEIQSPAQAARVVHERHRRGEVIPGFGHRLYKAHAQGGGDPRAQPLLLQAQALASAERPAAERLAVLTALCEAMAAHGLPAMLDAGLVAVCSALGLPPGSGAALFAVGRSAGWVAHILEQRQDGELLRPRARYIGPGGPPSPSSAGY